MKRQIPTEPGGETDPEAPGGETPDPDEPGGSTEVPGGSENGPEGVVKPSAGADSGQGETASPESAGLGGGEIAGIVVGSLAGAAAIGFSIFWFIIKKKSFADLLAALKLKK